MRRRVTLDNLPPYRSADILPVWPRSVFDVAAARPKQPRAGQQFGVHTAIEATAMIKSLLCMVPIALIGLVATEASAAPAAWAGSIGRNITATVPEGTDVPLVL